MANDDGDSTSRGSTDPDQQGPELESLDFAGAMAEMERIVAELESDTVDVDRLAERVERAAVLVTWCRDRIDGTRFRVEEMLERLE